MSKLRIFLMSLFVVFSTSAFANPLQEFKKYLGAEKKVTLNGVDERGYPCSVFVVFSPERSSGLNLSIQLTTNRPSNTVVGVTEKTSQEQKARFNISGGMKTIYAELNQKREFMAYKFSLTLDARNLISSVNIESTHWFLGTIPRRKNMTCSRLVEVR